MKLYSPKHGIKKSIPMDMRNSRAHKENIVNHVYYSIYILGKLTYGWQIHTQSYT